MKKRICTLLALLLIFAGCLCPAALAEDSPEAYIIDEAGLLTDEQLEQLQSLAAYLFDEGSVGVYVITVEDYTANSAGGVTDAAVMSYWYYDMGHGPDQDGLILFLSMKERDYALLSYGPVAEACFGDEEMDLLEEAFLDNFRDDDWAGGIYDYLLVASDFLRNAEEPEAAMEPAVGPTEGDGAVVAPGIGSLLPLLVMLILLSLL